MSNTKKEKKRLPEEDRIDCEKISDKEIEEWVVTTSKVLVVLKDEDGSAYKRIYDDFISDLKILKKVKRIDDNDYEDILENL